MKYCRFQFNGQAYYGLVEPVAGRDTILRILLTPPEESDGDVEGLRTRKIDAIALEEAELLPPVRPSKIVCVGRNYRAHAEELGHEIPTEPILFLKPTSALLTPGGTVRRPKISQRVDYEAELCIVIGRTCHHLAADEDVRPYILGYTCLNDVTARDLQKKRRAVDPWKELRHLLSSRPGGSKWNRSLGGVGSRNASQRRSAAGRQYAGFSVSCRCGNPAHGAGHDSFFRRSDCYWYT